MEVKRRVLAIIQARYNSTRFQGKVVKKINNKTILEILIRRLSKSKYISKTIVACSQNQKDKAILNICAVLQKFVDMSISVNLYYNYAHYPDGNIPLSILIKDQIQGYKYGVKNFYYCNTPDGDSERGESDKGCESGSCSI